MQHPVSRLIDPKMQLYRFFLAAERSGGYGLAMLALPDLADEAAFCPTKHLLLPIT
ncbi:hypothetical protein [Comamonas piscis]